MLWEIKNNKNATKRANKIYSIYDQSVITDSQVWKWFSNFRSDDTLLKDESRSEGSSDHV